MTPDGREDEARGERDGPDEGVRRWLLPYFEDSSLWPVLAVVIASLAAFLTPVLLYASRFRDLRAIAATALIGFLTVRVVIWESRMRGRPGGITVALALVWGLAIAAVVYGSRTGLL